MKYGPEQFSCKYLNDAAKLVPSDENKQLETQAPINYAKGMKFSQRNWILYRKLNSTIWYDTIDHI